MQSTTDSAAIGMITNISGTNNHHHSYHVGMNDDGDCLFPENTSAQNQLIRLPTHASLNPGTPSQCIPKSNVRAAVL